MPALSEVTDGDLLAMAGSEPEAFGELFRRHSRSVYAYYSRRTGNLDLAEDLTSVVFMEAFRRRRKLRLSNTSALPWLIGMANNIVRNADRSLRRYRSALDRIPVPAHGASSEEATITRLEAQEALAHRNRRPRTGLLGHSASQPSGPTLPRPHGEVPPVTSTLVRTVVAGISSSGRRRPRAARRRHRRARWRDRLARLASPRSGGR